MEGHAAVGTAERGRRLGLTLLLVAAAMLLPGSSAGQGPAPDLWPTFDASEARSGPSLATPEPQSVAPGPTSDFWLPFGSLLVPGVGQYTHGAFWAGAAHTGAAILGAYTTRAGDSGARLPRAWRDQVASQGLHLVGTAGFLSAWDTFQRSAANQRAAASGAYAFLQAEEDLGDLLSAPFDPTFLGRWTTWVGLAQSAIVATYVLSTREEATRYEPFRGHDPAYVGSLALNAAVGEEAAFRGWLLPTMTEKFGGRFWLANATQAVLFGAGHTNAGSYRLVITAAAAFYGWQTRRDGWSVREAVFLHFWHNVMAGTAMLLTDERALVPIVSGRIAVP